jgi:carotenoid cleavage dioxygenase-like enzyme
VQCDYILYFIPDQAPAKREVIAKIPVKRPAYMHSFAVTENYIIFTEFPVLIKPFELILGTKPFIKNFTWEPEKGTGFIVVDRHHGNVIGRYVTKPFFAFHHVNAFEKENQIHLDIVTYENGDIVLGDELSVNNRSSSKLFSTKLERFYLSLETGDIQSEVLLPYTNELPRINSQLAGSSYRFVYSISTRDQATYINEILFSDGLYKIDTVDKRFLKWSQEGCLPGEPVFVASPKGIEEDDGVVLSVVIDRKDNSSFLLILDGKSFQEIGRAKAPHLIPVGLHGVYF